MYEANLAYLATLWVRLRESGVAESAKFFDLDLSQAEAIAGLQSERIEHLAKHSDLPLWSLNLRMASLPSEADAIPLRSVGAMVNVSHFSLPDPTNPEEAMVVESNRAALRVVQLFLPLNGAASTAACFGTSVGVMTKLAALSPAKIDRIARESVYPVCRLVLTGPQILTIQSLELRQRRSTIVTMLRTNLLSRQAA